MDTKGFLLLPVALLAISHFAANAVEITVNGEIQHYRSILGPNQFTSGADNLFVGLNVNPSPKTDPGIGDSTDVTATQNGTTLVLSQPTSVFNPEFYFATTPYDSSLTDSWLIEVSNTDPAITNSPVTVATPSVGMQPPAAFVKNMSLAGSISDGFTVSWESPSGADGTQVDVTILDGTPWGTTLHNAFLGAGDSSYDIPDVLLSGDSLEIGNTYMVTISNRENRSDGSILAQTSTFFEFSPTLESINAFLPTVDGDGVYNFNVTVNEANEFIAIDPEVAVGYDYATGEGNPNFAAVILPFVGDDLFELWLFDATGVPYVADVNLQAGDVFDFGPGGVDMFRILGIETSAMLDPTDPTAFVTLLSFIGPGEFTGTMTPITEEIAGQVSSPNGLLLIILGLSALAGLQSGRRNLL